VSVTDPHPGPNAPPLALQAGASPSAHEVLAYLEHKRSEVHEVRLRPHSWKFALYFDA
jgi:hypothetical protein